MLVNHPNLRQTLANQRQPSQPLANHSHPLETIVEGGWVRRKGATGEGLRGGLGVVRLVDLVCLDFFLIIPSPSSSDLRNEGTHSRTATRIY